MSRRDNPVSTQGPAFFRVSSHCHPRSNHPQCSVVTIAEPQGCSARMLFRFVWLISRIRILLGPHQSFKKSREKPPHVASQSPTPHQRMGVSSASPSIKPAARLVMPEITETRRPQCRAASTSGTVDMPTASAPRILNALIYAGVSKLGPGHQQYTPSARSMPDLRAAVRIALHKPGS